MDDQPSHPDDPFAGLPPELRAMLEQLGGPEGLAAAQRQLASLLGTMTAHGSAPAGPVDWELATRAALQVAAEGDRSPSDDERRRAADAAQLAEHWLDATGLPSPPDAGRLLVTSRQGWVNAAIVALRGLVEPVAAASADALVAMAQDQLGELGAGDPADAIELDQLGFDHPGMEIPPAFRELLQGLSGEQLTGMLRMAGAALVGLQAGQVIGKLARQLLGQYDLGIPTAPRAEAQLLAVNVEETFAGYDADPTEVAIVLALTEGAHRRLYHAVPWLEAHVHGLVARFAAAAEVDVERLQELAQDLMVGVDPDDPDSLREAMEKAARLEVEPTEQQRRILTRLQTVVGLVGAWARLEVARAVDGRLPSLERIEEVLRRRRATRGDGEELLAALLGLDLHPDDEHVGEHFVAMVDDVLGPLGLRRALAHPENLPEPDELAEPGRWLARMIEDVEVPDDPSALFDDGDPDPGA